MKTKKTTKGVAAYVRVSTVGQNEAGQRAEIERWLTGSGIDRATVTWYVDKRTGDNLKRPAFERLQAAVFAGEIGTVVVYKLDRLSRKLRDGIDVLCDWCERGLRVVAVTQLIDFNGTMGKMLAAVLLGVAEMEQETRRERQAAGIAVAKKAGKYRGRKVGTTKASPQRALALRAKGLSVEEIAKSLGIGRNTAYTYLRGKASQALTA
jgi:DNA invertase Pin-like site-specific DNA recombinase